MGLLALAAGSAAAELAVRDLRVSVETRPTDFDYEYTAPLVSRSGTDGFDAGLGLSIGGRWSLSRPGSALGLVVGGDVSLDAQRYQGADGLATTWARLATGIGWSPSDRWTLLAEGGFLYGRSSISLPGTAAAPVFNASGDSTGYDVRLSGMRQIDRRLALSGTVGWLSMTHDLSEGDNTLRLNQAGWFAGIGLVWRFTDAPARLE